MTKNRANGEGNIRKRKDGRWEGRIVVGHKENGDSIFRYIYADNQKELTAKLRQNIDAYQGVDLTEESRMTLSEWLDRWLEQMALTLRPGTLKRYRGDMDRHVKPRLGQKKLTQLTAEDLRELYRFLLEQGRIAPRPGQSPGLSPATVRGIHAALHQALQAAADQGLMPNNPAKQVDPPKITHKPMKILNEEQVNIFLEVTDQDPIWRDFFYTELTTGLRLGEICGLMWSDFDGRKGTLSVSRALHREKGRRLTAGDTKTYAGTRKILLPSTTAERLADRKKTGLRGRFALVGPSFSGLWLVMWSKAKAEIRTIKNSCKKQRKHPLFAWKAGVLWSCYPDLNWGPHPYQHKFFHFSNLFALFIGISAPDRLLSHTFESQDFRWFRLRLWLVVWSVWQL